MNRNFHNTGKQSAYDVFHEEKPRSTLKHQKLRAGLHSSTVRTVATLFALVLIHLYDGLFSDIRNAFFEINLKLASYILTDQQASEFNSSNWFCTPSKM